MATNDVIDPEAGGAEARIQGLIRERNQARSDLQEAKAEIATLTEAATSSKGSVEQAVAAARGEMQAKIVELEGQIRRASNRELLLADKIPPDQIDDLVEYLDFQHSKAAPVEGTDAKPEFKDWYSEARKTNRVLRAAMKASVRDAADADPGTADATDTGTKAPVAAKPSAPAPRVPIPPKPAVVPVQPGSNGREVDLSKLKVGTAEWAAAKERVKKQVFQTRA